MSVAINGTDGITYNDGSLQPSAPVGKNLIINGDMRIDQRNATITPTSNDDFCVDRWSGREETDGAISMQQSTDAPAGFVNSLKVTVTTADASIASGQFTRIAQPIEGYNIADLNWGTADAQSVTLSFWIKSSVTGNFYGGIRNSAGNRAYVFSYSVSSASTWEKKTVTIAGDTTGTWLTDNNKGIWLLYSIGTGTDFQGTAGAWQSANVWSVSGDNGVMGTLNATWYLTGVQLEANTTATPFEHLQYGQQLALCQRYYTKFTTTNTYSTFGFGTAATNARMTTQYHFPTTMRAAPSTSYSGTLSVLYGTSRTNITSSPDSQLNFNGGYVNYDVSGTPFTAITYSGLIGANNDASCYVEFNSEL